MPRPSPTLAGRRCLVLGGGGFLGRNLCERLVALDAEVRSFGRTEAQDDRIHSVTGRFDDRVALSSAVEGQEIVFHLISGSVPESSNRDPSAEMLGGPLATVHLLDICRSANVRKIIFASSGGAIYGVPKQLPIVEDSPTNPISAYGISKLTIEKHLHLYDHLHGLAYQALRIANPYGRFQLGHKQQGLVGTLIHRALGDMPIEIWGDGSVTRDFIHVDDVIDAFVAAIDYGGPHRVFNVGSGRGLSINTILDSLENAIGKGPLRRVYTPGRAADVPVNILDTTLIRAEIGWTARVGWVNGLRETIAWMASQDPRLGARRQ